MCPICIRPFSQGASSRMLGLAHLAVAVAVQQLYHALSILWPHLLHPQLPAARLAGQSAAQRFGNAAPGSAPDCCARQAVELLCDSAMLQSKPSRAPAHCASSLPQRVNTGVRNFASESDRHSAIPQPP
jgi:hypothetical protein